MRRKANLGGTDTKRNHDRKYVLGSQALVVLCRWKRQPKIQQRRDRIRSDPELLRERSEELYEIRNQIRFIDSKRMSVRVRDEVDLQSRSLITGAEWGKESLRSSF